jgi:hypothetical protein
MVTKSARNHSIDSIDIERARTEMARSIAKQAGAKGIEKKIVADLMVDHHVVTLENAKKLAPLVAMRRRTVPAHRSVFF